MYTTILLPIDLEHDSSWVKALPAATMLADATGAALHVVNVVPDLASMMVSQYFPKDFADQSAADAAKHLAAFAEEHMPGRTVGIHVKSGSVHRGIIAAAEEVGADLIVMGSHRPEIADILIGPNAEQVTRHTKASVMIARP